MRRPPKKSLRREALESTFVGALSSIPNIGNFLSPWAERAVTYQHERDLEQWRDWVTDKLMDHENRLNGRHEPAPAPATVTREPDPVSMDAPPDASSAARGGFLIKIYGDPGWWGSGYAPSTGSVRTAAIRPGRSPSRC